MIILDASALIALLDSADPHHAAVTAELEARATDRWATGALTIAEVMVLAAQDDELLAAVAEDVVGLELEVLPLTETDVEQLARLRATTGVRMPDCCVLLAGQTTGGTVLTTDLALADAARRLGNPVLP